MNIPFTSKQFMKVFYTYNTTVFPMQIIFYLLAAVCIIAIVQKRSNSDRITSLILCLLWLWMGLIYHIGFFSAINKAAYIFGVLYILQALLFISYGFFKKQISFEYSSNIYGVSGSVLIFFALVAYPIIGYLAGHIYPATPTFGLPCPTTIFTFGVLLWTNKRFPFFLLIIPFLWSIIGFTAALSLGMYEDFGLLISGLFATALLMIRDRSTQSVRI